MKALQKRINWSAMALIVALLAFIGYQTHATRAAPAGPAVIATINIERLFDQLRLRAVADEMLTAVAAELDAEIQQLVDEIKVVEDDRELFPEGSPQHQENEDRWALKAFQLQSRREWARQKLDNERSSVLRDIYEQMKRAVREVADDREYDVVFVDDSIAELPPAATEAEMMRQIGARRMLYANDAIDITDEVAHYMNSRFTH